MFKFQNTSAHLQIHVPEFECLIPKVDVKVIKFKCANSAFHVKVLNSESPAHEPNSMY